MQKLPTTLYDNRQIRELERLAIQEHGLSGFELMSRAGYQLFECIQQQYPNASTLAVFCGGGNNGGDGYILASLALTAGWSVSVYSLCDPGLLTGDAMLAYHSFVDAGGLVKQFAPPLAIKVDVVVDALLGTGLDRPVSGDYAAAIDAINNAYAGVVAVDVPSGINADSGQVMGSAVKADCTLTFIGLKRGLFTGQAPEYCGAIFYASLAVPKHLFVRVPSTLRRLSYQPFAKRSRHAHKGDFGHVLAVGGDVGYTGAIRLAAEAACRVGAGLVTVATRAVHAGLINIGRPELMCQGVESPDEFEALAARCDVIVIGPGLGQGAWARQLLRRALGAGKPLLVDADALNLLAQPANDNWPQAAGQWILTPHPGEAARLLACPVAAVNEDRFAAVSRLQQRYGGVVVLKGAGTLVADADGTTVATCGNPGMASGGMGDVLAGVIGGLLAQGRPPSLAAQQGVYVHGLAADLSAKQHGERGMLAGDLMPFLRQLVNA